MNVLWRGVVGALVTMGVQAVPGFGLLLYWLLIGSCVFVLVVGAIVRRQSA